jgi:hypothetical protein
MPYRRWEHCRALWRSKVVKGAFLFAGIVLTGIHWRDQFVIHPTTIRDILEIVPFSALVWTGICSVILVAVIVESSYELMKKGLAEANDISGKLRSKAHDLSRLKAAEALHYLIIGIGGSLPATSAHPLMNDPEDFADLVGDDSTKRTVGNFKFQTAYEQYRLLFMHFSLPLPYTPVDALPQSPSGATQEQIRRALAVHAEALRQYAERLAAEMNEEPSL